MAETKIEWCDFIFNPWIGCSRVSLGCEHCYAEAQVRRAPNLILGKGPHPLLRRNERIWGVMSPRRVTSDTYWDQPLRWNRAAAKAGERRRVFCASMADVFEDWKGEPTGFSDWPIPGSLNEARNQLWELILDTPHLDWLLLTKRPQNVLQMVPPSWLSDPRTHRWPRNVWIGCTVEDQRRAEERLPHLLRIPAQVRFVSYEPALESVDFEEWLGKREKTIRRLMFGRAAYSREQAESLLERGIDWLIVGGESGPGARPFDLAWARSAVQQCQAAGVPVFVKQFGALPCDSNVNCSDYPDSTRFSAAPPVITGAASARLILRDRKGGDMAEWPENLRRREFPYV